jgi:hypothetical protein
MNGQTIEHARSRRGSCQLVQFCWAIERIEVDAERVRTADAAFALDRVAEAKTARSAS